ncbi:beta-ketoacyl synthase N-terminal-like domain-containing protein, partial [Dactylosporangium sp. NPDC005572]|uniref:beta-ketoacyl synthase N-terminal-like domain-containing protein n=1 Tax=Dactylosporangium sp. NPDC005572 TaxID=3156889 RepID=UPI0033A7C2B0
MTHVLDRTIRDFALRIRPDDILLRDHRVRGRRVLPEAVLLDALYRAAAAAGTPAADVELTDLRFLRPLAVDDGVERRVVFRGTGDGAATHVRIAAGEPLAEAVVRRTGPPPGAAPLEVSVVDGPGSEPLDSLYDGLGHGAFLRATGRRRRDGDRVTALLRPGPDAHRRRGDFLLHPTLLDAALTLLGPGRRVAGIRRFRAWAPLRDAAYAVAEGDGLRLYDTDGTLAAECEGVRFAAGRARRSGRLDIAVVGVAGRYPGAEDVGQLWDNVLHGRDAITEVPASRWGPGDYPTGDAQLPRFGGFLADVDAFDPRFFRIPPSAAHTLDPQERLFLQTAYAAVEHAGYRPDDFRAPNDRVGVFVGATWADYRLLGVESTRRGAPLAVPSLPSSVPNRVSYYFGFTGPSLTVDTACSSSLTALHLACRSIADGECDAALAGGVNLLLHPDKYLLLRTLTMASSDGRCRSFGAGGDGYVPGEGVGAVLLKPLERAEADGDTIHGVILSVAVNHGGRAAGMTVPNPVAQGDVIARALADAAVDPDTVGYVEAHGTGTALGDPVEVAGLHRAFAGRAEPCALGSVKSNVGHLESAAGMVALTKVLLQLRHGRIAPSLHSAELNPGIDFAESPFEVPQTARDWPRPTGGGPRRAGVSSFGAGGANAHVVVEEYPAAPAGPGTGAEELLVLSARTPERLAEYAGRVAAHLAAGPAERFADIARTLQAGRPALEHRLALVARDAAGAADRLRRHLAGEAGAAHSGAADGSGDPRAAERTFAERYAAGDLDGAARAFAAGATPDWAAVNGGPDRRVPVPGYPFERGRYWIDLPAVTNLSANEPAVTDPSVTGPTATTDDGRPAAADANTEDTAGPAGEGEIVTIDAVVRQFEEQLAPTDRELEAAYPDLGRYAARRAARELTAMGLPDAGGTPDELRAALGVRPQYTRFTDACFEVLERHGLLRRSGRALLGTGPVPDPSRLRAEILARHPDAEPFLRLLDVAVPAYPAVLRGETPATEVLFPSSGLDLMTGVYRGNPAYDFYTGEVARFVAAAAGVRARQGRAPVRVLEIGAGTGSTTQAVLEALAPLGGVEYHYTDVGGSFVAHGRRTFAARYPFVRFRVYDADRDPAGQGLDPGTFDVVLAASALHAVTDIDRTLGLVRTLLAPGGLLVLGEPTANVDVFTLTIGLLDGWHRYTDPQRRLPHSPLLSVEGWRLATQRAGYGAFAGFGPGLTGDAKPSFRILTAAAPGTPAEAPPPAAPPPAAPAPAVGVPAVSAEPAGVRAEELEPVIARIVADGLGLPVGEIRPSISFAEYGVDSILAVQIVEKIGARLGITVKPTVVFDHPSVRALARHAATLGASLEGPAEPAPAAPEAPVQPTPAPESAGIDIAVIGMAGRYPGAGDHRELWRNLVAGHEAVTEVPAGRWDVDAVFAPWPPTPDRTYSRWGGYIADPDRFDPYFFNIVPAEADVMDPQQRLFLQESWRALEDAGIDPSRLQRARCGVFAGSPPPDYVSLLRERGQAGGADVFTGNSPSILPARVAYHLDLTGPCVGIDTACSSSLVAVHQACQSLAARECDLALAGGVAVYSTLEHLLQTSSLGMLSPTGQCRAFDETADGIVMSEGVGVVVLKPLARALADGDPIYGVIKGIGVNQDGRTNGITAPSARSQTELELAVYDRYGIDPAGIGYVEAHGTGTKLGDPVEVDALTAAFRAHTDRRGDVPIGSIKTNIGHTSHAAGVAGLIKVLLSMREGVIPPTLHFATGNALAGFADSPFHVNTEVATWPEGPRAAAVSSFGFSGTNCHVVVAGHDDRRAPTAGPAGPVLVPLSARSEESLRAAAGALAAHLAATPGLVLADVAATLQLGRAAFEHRLAVSAGSVEQLRARLALCAAGQRTQGVWLGSVDPDAAPAPAVAPGPDLAATAEAWVGGAAVDFARWYAGRPPRRINLPGYVFARDRCWPPDPPAAPARPATVGG